MKYRFYYTGIRVRNLKRSLDFYTEAFGMKVVNEGTMGHGGKYVQLVGDGARQKLELHWYPPRRRVPPPHPRGGAGGSAVRLGGGGPRQKPELNWSPPGSRFHTPYRKGDEIDHLAFVVSDVEKAYAELLRKGGKPAA